jgi:hypothetical protein
MPHLKGVAGGDVVTRMPAPGARVQLRPRDAYEPSPLADNGQENRDESESSGELDGLGAEP